MLNKTLNSTMFALMVISVWGISLQSLYHIVGKEVATSVDSCGFLGILIVSVGVWLKSRELSV